MIAQKHIFHAKFYLVLTHNTDVIIGVNEVCEDIILFGYNKKNYIRAR
jgi:hypothetical protein